LAGAVLADDRQLLPRGQAEADPREGAELPVAGAPRQRLAHAVPRRRVDPVDLGQLLDDDGRLGHGAAILPRRSTSRLPPPSPAEKQMGRRSAARRPETRTDAWKA